MKECANVLFFKQTGDKLKLFQAYFCKVRLCPMCNWRRSLKIAFHNKRIVEVVNERENIQWLFLTLTVRNVEGKKLKDTMDTMTKAWNNFSRYAKFKKSIKGYFRAMEVTKNRDTSSDWNGTYHPHFHVLLCVPASYFKKPNLYIKQADWTQMWKKAMKIEYDPIVHVQKVKPRKQSPDFTEIESDVKKAIDEQKAIIEISKYPIKDCDVVVGDKITSDNIETILDLDNALAYKRLIAYGGILKDVHKELNLDDPEDGDLIHLDEKNNDEMANGAIEVMAYWHVGLKNYVVSKGDK